MREFFGRQLGIPSELSAHIPLWILVGCLIARRLGAESLEARLMGVAMDAAVLAVRAVDPYRRLKVSPGYCDICGAAPDEPCDAGLHS